MEIDRRELEDETIPPQWICMTCKTVVGPVVDDDKHKCNCKDVYLVDLWLVAPVGAVEPGVQADGLTGCGCVPALGLVCPMHASLTIRRR